jgi:hypothetical protein
MKNWVGSSRCGSLLIPPSYLSAACSSERNLFTDALMPKKYAQKIRTARAF